MPAAPRAQASARGELNHLTWKFRLARRGSGHTLLVVHDNSLEHRGQVDAGSVPN